LLPHLDLLLPPLLLSRELNLKNTRTSSDFRAEPVIIFVKVQSPQCRIFFHCTESFPAKEGKTAVLTSAIKRSSKVRLGIETDTVFNLIGLLVDVYPIHDRRFLGNGSDEAFILSIRVRQVVACIWMSLGMMMDKSAVPSSTCWMKDG
jgi:hypothetical protein